MIAIGNTVVSEEVIEEHFTCDLNKCKGACCVAGDSGAPLEEHELLILKKEYDKIKPFMTADGIRTIEKKGKYVYDEEDKEFVTPLIERNEKEKKLLRHSNDSSEKARSEMKECAYTIFENGIAGCAIEKSFHAGKIDFQKPVSCHLYPVRTKKMMGYEAVNYNRWSVCSPACALGKQTKIPVYKFVSSALVRKYGQHWFSELEAAAELWRKRRNKE